MVAATTSRELREATNGLDHMPERFAVIHQATRGEVRRRVCGRYNIYYCILPDRVLVLRVVHHSRDQGAILSEL